MKQKIKKIIGEKNASRIRNFINFITLAYRPHWCRVVMIEETRRLISGLNYPQMNALEISGDFWTSFPFKSYRSLYYPEFDLCNTSLDEKFDLIIAEQIFEHLLWPYRAGKNVYKMLENGGYFLVTTPFFIKIHEAPVDCTRWTEKGLKYFLAECGFQLENIQTNSWGNRKCVKSNFSSWTPYIKGIHSLINEPEFPMVVWALAEK